MKDIIAVIDVTFAIAKQEAWKKKKKMRLTGEWLIVYELELLTNFLCTLLTSAIPGGAPVYQLK